MLEKFIKEYVRAFSRFIEFSSLRFLFIVVNHEFKINVNTKMFYFYVKNIAFFQIRLSDFEKHLISIAN